MTSTLTKLFVLSCATIALYSCKSEKETLEVETPESYILPLQPGKFITYRLDSTVFTHAGRQEELHSYQEKQVVDASFTDNLGRTSYRIYRYLRDVGSTQPWVPAGTFFITPLKNTVEVVENNMRIVALSGPIRVDQSWNGNHYLASEPYSYLYNFSNDNDMGSWDFVIESVGESATYNNQTINDILTVTHINELEHDPISEPETFASKNVSFDKYAKGIGLVYQEHILWEYQPNPDDTPFYIGFGVKRSLLEHN